jgi:hypothetical protein
MLALLLTKDIVQGKNVPVETVVHTSLDDMANPKNLSEKLHTYDSHLGTISEKVENLR